MNTTVNLYSKKFGEISRFLHNFYDDNFYYAKDDSLKWQNLMIIRLKFLI